MSAGPIRIMKLRLSLAAHDTDAKLQHPAVGLRREVYGETNPVVRPQKAMRRRRLELSPNTAEDPKLRLTLFPRTSQSARICKTLLPINGIPLRTVQIKSLLHLQKTRWS